jgi:hypothetical protein
MQRLGAFLAGIRLLALAAVLASVFVAFLRGYAQYLIGANRQWK